MEVLDKGKAAAVTTIIETRDKQSGKVIFENQMTVLIRGAGGFGGRRAGKGEVAFLKCTQSGRFTRDSDPSSVRAQEHDFDLPEVRLNLLSQEIGEILGLNSGR